MKKFFILLIGTILLCSCNDSTKSAEEIAAGSPDNSNEFGGVFTGMIPCADCPGIYAVVDFSKDTKYFENLKYLERNAQFADSGRWFINDSLISIRFNNDSSFHYFRLINDSTIRMLDADKQPIVGRLEDFYFLKKKDTLLQR